MTDSLSTTPVPPEVGATPREELAYRLRQQSLLAEFGRFALSCRDLDALLQRATELCGDGMATELCKALEYQPDDNRLRVRAGIGWAAGVVGRATIGADMESPAGYALHMATPVISNHLTAESRFRTPKLLADHGVQRAIKVIIQGDGQPFGVLEVDSPNAGRFEDDDLAFMQGFANVLGIAIDRQRAEAHCKGALARLHQEQQRRRESEERNHAIIEGARDYAILTTDPQGCMTSWSPGAAAIFGWAAEEIVGKSIEVLFTPEDRADGVPERELAAALKTGYGEDVRWHLRKDGTRLWANGSVRRFDYPDGRVRGFLKIARDDTERREAAEIVTREVSHRVKNSLALVASLLGLQARATEDEAARRVLQDAQARVGTIAGVHDQLWQAKDVGEVDLAPFLGDLCAKLQQSAPHHHLVCEFAPVVLSADHAVPLGLLVTELVTNAFKYAFPDKTAGKVQVRFDHPAPDRLRLEVCDQGIGLPDGFDLSHFNSSLGMRLITTFARQLDGTLTVTSAEPGSRFTLDMPYGEGM